MRPRSWSPSPSHDQGLERRAAELEATIAADKEGLRTMVAAFRHKEGPFLEVAMEEIDDFNSKIRRDEADLDKVQDEIRRLELGERTGLVARLRAAKAKIASSDLQERNAARRTLSAELKRMIEAVVLYDGERRKTVRMKPNRNGTWMEYDVV